MAGKVRAVSATTQAAGTPETPSQTIIKAGGRIKTATFQDSLGRSITIRTLDITERMRFFRLLGEHTKNELYFSHAFAAAIVRRIDDVDFPHLPANIMQLEAKVAQLDEDGIDAVTTNLMDLLGERPDQAEVKELAKN